MGEKLHEKSAEELAQIAQEMEAKMPHLQKIADLRRQMPAYADDDSARLPRPGKKARRTGIGVSLVGLAGAGLLAGMFLAGGHGGGEPTTTQAPATATSSEAAGSASPTGTAENGFTPKETDTKDGWIRTSFALSDGSTVMLDKLTYQPSMGSRTLDAGAIVSGDGNLDGHFNTDTNAQSGQITVNLEQGAVLTSDYGLSAYENFDSSKTDAIVNTIATKTMKEKGACGLDTGCPIVLENAYNNGVFTDLNGTPEASATPCATPTPEAKACPCASPETCTGPGYDIDLPNLYGGDLDKLKADFAANPDKVLGQNKMGQDVHPRDYVITVKPGEKVAVQGDVIVLKNGKLIKDYDTGTGSESTGAITYVNVQPTAAEDQSETIYAVFGGDVHKMDCTTTDAQGQTLVDGYVSGMEGTYDTNGRTDKVFEYDQPSGTVTTH